MFVFILTYRRPLEIVEQHLEAHKEYLDRYYSNGTFLMSGRRNPRTGGVIICDAADKETARNIMQDDPFFKNEVAEYELIEFEPSKCNAALASYIDKTQQKR